MSDAAYFSAFSEPPLGAHARRLRCIDRKRKKCLVDGEQERQTERERGKEREGEQRKGGRKVEKEKRWREQQGSKFYYVFEQKKKEREDERWRKRYL